jgi:hypothetical protein
MTIIETPSPAAPRRAAGDALPRELFTLYARNAELLLFVGGAWLFIGCALAVGAVWLTFFTPGPPPQVSRFLGGLLFFYAALIITPAIHLLRYRIEVREADEWPTSDTLANVLEQQRRFWRFIGLLLLASVAGGLLFAIYLGGKS